MQPFRPPPIVRDFARRAFESQQALRGRRPAWWFPLLVHFHQHRVLALLGRMLTALLYPTPYLFNKIFLDIGQIFELFISSKNIL